MDCIKKYFDELSVAEAMDNDKSFSEGYSRRELLVYAKYLKYKKVIDDGIDYKEVTSDQMKKYDKEVERELIGFCEKCSSTFNYVTHYQDIDFAIANSNKYKLRLPYPLPITRSEWDAIKTVRNEKYQRMLFIMLVDAKFYKHFNTSVEKKETPDNPVYYIRMTESEIKKLSKIKYDSESEKVYFLGTIRKLGLFAVSESRLRTWYVKFVDPSEDQVIEYITDYEHLNLYFDKLNGEKIGKCKHCEKLFRQNKNGTALYCYRHRGKISMISKKITCVDCGEEFEVSSKDRKTIRCKACKKIYDKNWQKEYYLQRKNKVSN